MTIPNPRCRASLAVVSILIAAATAAAQIREPAKLRLPNAFSDHMVLQREKATQVWGFAVAGDAVVVRFAGQEKKAVTDASGRWSVHLDPMPMSSTGRKLTVRSGDRSVAIVDVLVGDVWVLGGQSNMEAALENIRDGELEILSANHAAIRLMTVPLRASPRPARDFARLDEYNSWSKVTERKGEWAVARPETVRLFSAVGYVFGRRIHLVTGVPIGLIDTSWGGTTVEAWISRKTLESIERARPLLESWDRRIVDYDPESSLAGAVRAWENRATRLERQGKKVPPKPTRPRPSPAVDRNNPGAAYNGILAPLVGMSVKGALFYQGINNAVGGARPKLYAETFAALIPEWRRVFGDPDLPFGICQMVSWGFPPEVDATEELMVAPAPYIREAQLIAHRTHPGTGFVVAYDLGHIQMHSPYKVPLGERLARWALATQHGLRVTYKTPLFERMEIEGSEATCYFDRNIHPKHGGRAKILGFAVAGADRHFYPALAKMTKPNAVRVSSPHVRAPLAVRYAWATHPHGTLVGEGHDGLPAAPFRTDEWEWKDAPFAPRGSPEDREHRAWQRALLEQAKRQAAQRREAEARAVLPREPQSPEVKKRGAGR